MSRKISLGVVGLGRFGTVFVPIFRDHPLVKRIALCDIDGKKLANASKEFKINETYRSLNEICKTDLDALVIITQPWLHAPQVIQAMEAGKHVYSAVPIVSPKTGDNREVLDWCDKLIKACRKTGMRYMMGETSIFRAETQYCIKKARKGEFGDIVFIEAEYLHDTNWPACDLIQVQMERTGLSKSGVYKQGGGVPMHYITHSASVPIAIAGAHATEVSCFGYSMPNDNYFRNDSITGNIFGNEIATFKMSTGALGRVIEGRRIGHNGREGLVRVLGTKASIETAEWEKYQWITKTESRPIDVNSARKDLPKELRKHYDPNGHGGSHPYLVNEFVESVSTGRQPVINAWETVRYCALGAMAHESALKGGKLMKVPDWGNAPK